MYELFLYESGDSLEYGRPCGKKEGSMDNLVRYVKEHVGKHYYAAVLKGSGENVTFTRGDRCIYARALKGASSTVQNVLTNILWLGNLLRATENDLLSIEVKDSEKWVAEVEVREFNKGTKSFVIREDLLVEGEKGIARKVPIEVIKKLFWWIEKLQKPVDSIKYDIQGS